MDITKLTSLLKPEEVGQEIYNLIVELYPICRSITGEGFRETMRILRNYIPVEIYEVPSGTKVFDWTVPKEWNIKDAYVKNQMGEKIIDFKKSNLHVVSYSTPVSGKMQLEELRKHLYTIPDRPEMIPYRTSYHAPNWGFCLSHNQYLTLRDEQYEVFIDSSLEDGHLTYGEYYLKGASDDEVLLSGHACHPSLCNDNLSGIALLTVLAKYLASTRQRYSYRFLFVPATIGPITWLSLNEDDLAKVKHGLIAACVGDSGKLTYKKSRQDTAEIDKAAMHILKTCSENYKVIDFSPFGYDERQYCSPGFNLPVGCLTRTPNGHYPEYHTSADDLDFVRPEFLGDSFSKYLLVISILEGNGKFLNQNPKCEPNLGKRDLYRPYGDPLRNELEQLALLWVLNFSDGSHSLLDIADKSGMGFHSIRNAASALLQCDLLKEI